ncbi:Putative aliphatic sulfonates transport permease protein SsuC [Aquimixticola soesokkakensis]|uniref:Putative aliphatic sulfonates transport permease protein SsuC n=1 Tax=Aquimixticola soesokkakensis TaxID=1519096 RepID=A0A1Y5T4K8_9RHOB|nr:ABC transporter permease subunit [Aquimixticola soesokkakensis]SLN55110.1 Putative aliphatic sulfonates transport permease protein SsuC [Aquimixticola soesokkakensis]
MNRLVPFLSRYWAVLLLVVVWHAWVTLGDLNSIVLPAPLPVLADVVTHPALYLTNAAQTMATALAGVAIGVLLGAFVAILAWASRLLAGLLTPLGLIFSSVPIVALIPILARVLGYDISTVVAIVAVSAFFPTFVFTGAGLRDLPRATDDLFKVLGATPWGRLRHLVLPATVPNVMISLRLTVPEGVLAAILAEFLMGRSGLGFMFREAASRFAMERALGTSLVVTLAAVLFFTLAHRAERAVKARWS